MGVGVFETSVKVSHWVCRAAYQTAVIATRDERYHVARAEQREDQAGGDGDCAGKNHFVSPFC